MKMCAFQKAVDMCGLGAYFWDDYPRGYRGFHLQLNVVYLLCLKGRMALAFWASEFLTMPS